jgi:hypothetical protein
MLLKVTVNGEQFIVDAPNKAIARSYGKKQLKVEVTELALTDLQGLDASTVVKVEPETSTKAEGEGAPAAEGAEQGETAAA